MNRAILVAALICLVQVGHAQSGKQNQQELFTTYFSRTAVLFKVHIPAEACAKIISQADSIVADPDSLKRLNIHDLLVASLNLRVCATSSELARPDRDLAVGLYGETVAEEDRREREIREKK